MNDNAKAVRSIYGRDSDLTLFGKVMLTVFIVPATVVVVVGELLSRFMFKERK